MTQGILSLLMYCGSQGCHGNKINVSNTYRVGLWAAFGGKCSTGMEVFLYVNIFVLSVAAMPMLGPLVAAV